MQNISKKDQKFTFEGAWSGNYYELYIRINSTDETVLEDALKRLWSHPTLSGCYLMRDIEPILQKKFSVNSIELARERVFGVATLPNGKQVACSTYPIIMDSEYLSVNFMIPFGSLCRGYEIGRYPFHDNLPLDWQQPIDDWLCDLSKYIFKKVRFNIGAFGFIDCENLEDLQISDKRYFGLLKRELGQLKIYHPTIYDYPFNIQ